MSEHPIPLSGATFRSRGDVGSPGHNRSQRAGDHLHARYQGQADRGRQPGRLNTLATRITLAPRSVQPCRARPSSHTTRRSAAYSPTTGSDHRPPNRPAEAPRVGRPRRCRTTDRGSAASTPSAGNAQEKIRRPVTSKSAAEDPPRWRQIRSMPRIPAECRDARGHNLVAGTGRRVSGRQPMSAATRLSATADTSIADFARNEIDQLPETDSVSTAATSASEVVRTISTTLSISSERRAPMSLRRITAYTSPRPSAASGTSTADRVRRPASATTRTDGCRAAFAQSRRRRCRSPANARRARAEADLPPEGAGVGTSPA